MSKVQAREAFYGFAGWKGLTVFRLKIFIDNLLMVFNGFDRGPDFLRARGVLCKGILICRDLFRIVTYFI